MSEVYSQTGLNLKTDLSVLPEKALDFAEEAIMAQAHLIVGIAQVYCPVDTGSLRDSIRVERGGEGEGWRRIRVRAGGYVTNPKTNRLVNYAVYVEARTPFLKPAVEEAMPQIKEMIRSEVVRGLSRE